ncbi:hypothetical protein NQ317_017240 [Molorchus minor]|uniref:Uncharacterized protein n=1 Tax=Molorchus minor TaxID=1323400 RepID=A0ABQ9J0Z5_9CUCU|nr:hypothetical protein NQ317_017240 [Molorchus minor]
MENEKWECILVDWVNCLKLSKPIQKLCDLKDGLFFTNLLKVMIFLQTPTIKYNRSLEKNKEISRLKMELELVQDEKEGLEEDLKVQVEKNNKMEKQLNQKIAEISLLRNEIVVLESRTPPHYQDKDLRETQNILRIKIENLEQIIEQCDKENKQLEEEKDADKAQIKILEAQCKMWLEKFIDTDNKLQYFSERCKEQEVKYLDLQSHCTELEALLEELKPRSSNESFNEESFLRISYRNRRSNNFEPTSCEDLAHSVVDVQLKEVQKENEELKLTVTKIENETMELKEHINKLLKDLDGLEKENSKYESALMTSNSKIDDMTLAYKKLNEDFCKLTEDYETITREHEKTQENLVQVVSVHQEIKSELEKILQEKTKEKECYSNKISDITLDYRKLEEQFCKLTDESDKMRQENTKLHEDLQKTLSERKEIAIELENVLQEKGREKEDCSNKLLELDKELQITKAKFEDSVKESSCKINDVTFKYRKLSADFDILTEENKNVVQENSKLQHELKEALSNNKKLTHELETALEEAVRKQEMYSSKICGLTKDLETTKDEFKDTVQKCNCKISDMALEYKKLNENFDNVTWENQIIVQDNTKLAKELETRNALFKDSLDKNNCKINDMALECRKHSEDFNKLTQENELIIHDSRKFCEELNKALINNKELKLELENILVDKTREQEAFSNKIYEISKELETIKVEFKDTVEKNNCKVNDMALEHKKLSENFDNLTQENTILNQENTKLRDELKKSLNTNEHVTLNLQKNFGRESKR